MENVFKRTQETRFFHTPAYEFSGNFPAPYLLDFEKNTLPDYSNLFLLGKKSIMSCWLFHSFKHLASQYFTKFTLSLGPFYFIPSLFRYTYKHNMSNIKQIC